MSRRYSVTLSKQAHRDLDAIDEYLLKNASDDTATRTRAELMKAIRDLSRMPHRFIKIDAPGSHRQNLHRRVVYPYLVFYQINESRAKVTIASVRHGRQRPLKSFPENTK